MKAFWHDNGIVNDQDLTWDSAGEAQAKRRNVRCPGTNANPGWDKKLGACDADNDLLAGLVTVPRPPRDRPQFLNCDEVPMASSEQGGDFYFTARSSCVPSYQNNLQGQCHGRLLETKNL